MRNKKFVCYRLIALNWASRAGYFFDHFDKPRPLKLFDVKIVALSSGARVGGRAKLSQLAFSSLARLELS